MEVEVEVSLHWLEKQREFGGHVHCTFTHFLRNPSPVAPLRHRRHRRLLLLESMNFFYKGTGADELFVAGGGKEVEEGHICLGLEIALSGGEKEDGEGSSVVFFL
ncbi:unnamed protein product [Linum trigynum]|uniref:Uncharacterized protein n=1 Tax=Linum trigynum TaxID=586398 RepID=A0AAV2FJK0_9ROSI